jgi:hypothetical protein
MTDYTRKKNPYKNFIDFLDTYQERMNLSYYESILLTKAIQTNYQKHYYPYIQNTNNNNNIENINVNKYLTWQKENEVNISNSLDTPTVLKLLSISSSSSSYIPFKSQNQIHKTKVEIPIVNLKNIGDILKILEEYPYLEENEYNIDLKSLQNIKEELELLNAMIGMETVKKSILQQMIYFIQKLHIVSSTNNTKNINNNANDYKNTIITGPPGTGKTEMAKIIGKMYAKLGILKKNMFKKVTRSDLVAGFLGQTAIKTRKVIEECLGGVLFLDEAYSLGLEDSFSKECVDTICEALSDHRDDLMMIVAGYENELNETFFKVNPGMNSRFMWRFNIDTYKPKELLGIFEKKMMENGWEYIEGFMNNKKKEEWFTKHKALFTHYGRDMELLFSYIKISHAQHIFGKDVSLRKKITEEDLEEGFQLFQQNKKEQTSKIYTPPYGMYV